MAAMAWISSAATKGKREEEVYEKLLEDGVDIICCNYPDRLVSFLKEKGMIQVEG